MTVASAPASDIRTISITGGDRLAAAALSFSVSEGLSAAAVGVTVSRLIGAALSASWAPKDKAALIKIPETTPKRTERVFIAKAFLDSLPADLPCSRSLAPEADL